jgi:hypothetical protein
MHVILYLGLQFGLEKNFIFLEDVRDVKGDKICQEVNGSCSELDRTR